MDTIQFKNGNGTTKYAPRTTEVAMYPNIDSDFATMSYKGRRIVLRESQVCGFRQLPNLPNGGQGMAIYNDIVVRMTTGTGHYIFRIAADGTTSQIATFTASTNHSNSLQFAPSLESGQTYPYLYVAELPDACSVLSISSSFAVTIVQRITLENGLLQGGNLQIGDDGYIWYTGCDRVNNTWQFVKFRKVLVSEGDVTLTSDDIVDRWDTTEVRPYSTYAFQGVIIKLGKIFQLYGYAYAEGQNYKRGYAVYDTATHAFITEIDLTSTITDEPEDLDVWNDSLVLCCFSNKFYQFKF